MKEISGTGGEAGQRPLASNGLLVPEQHQYPGCLARFQQWLLSTEGTAEQDLCQMENRKTGILAPHPDKASGRFVWPRHSLLYLLKHASQTLFQFLCAGVKPLGFGLSFHILQLSSKIFVLPYLSFLKKIIDSIFGGRTQGLRFFSFSYT